MPVLPDLKRERFANHVAAGKTQREAYKLSGYRAKDIDSAASRIANDPQVASRIKDLRRRIENATTKRVSEQISFTRELILRELWENAQEAKSVKGGSAVANRALELIGKEIGMFKEPEVKAPVKLDELPRESLEAMIAEAEAKVAAEAAAQPPATPITQ